MFFLKTSKGNTRLRCCELCHLGQKWADFKHVESAEFFLLKSQDLQVESDTKPVIQAKGLTAQ